MDRRERAIDELETLRLAMGNAQARLWTAMPGIVQAFPGSSGLGKMTVDVQPSVNGIVRNTQGVFESVALPKLLDCPVLWQGGGGVTLTFPIKPGDECLVIFASRCIDAWWQSGKIADPPDLRMHNLSDGFALVGVKSLPHGFVVDAANAVLRSDDGSAFISLNPTSKAIAVGTSGTLTVNASAGITMNSVTIDSSGNVVTQGNVTSKGKVLATHVHTDPQGGNTGVPV